MEKRSAVAPPMKPEAFILPKASSTTDIILSYLCGSRGLSRPLILDCVNKGLIYESQDHRNAVFIGHDRNSVARSASLRGCSSNPFRKDVAGSNRAFGFMLQSTIEKATTLFVFKNAIDALSFASLNRSYPNVHLLALPAYSKLKNKPLNNLPVSLEQFFSDHPYIRKVHLCFDNTRSGRAFAGELKKVLEASSYAVTDRPPRNGIDYNDALLAHRELQRDREQCR
ncbi:MAG TPA: DUF3991 and TOPRIM domain-containing protein [Clostridia bacterium]|nr:DUF3991 and TOPRIM domain-containing protein [Clostridia bacterium]